VEFPCSSERVAAWRARLEEHETIVGLEIARNQDAAKRSSPVIYLH